MKILSIEINNVASIADAKIDFANGPLAEEPLFLITGPTGAGKTTILNSICLALYNKTSAIADAPSDKKRSFGNISAKDPAQMLRRGAKNGSVKLMFEGNDGCTYEAVWEARKINTRSENRPEFDCSQSLRRLGDNPTEFSKKEAKEKIQELVGLDFDQFTRTTLLAQGKFDKFLKAKGDDKASILEKITNTKLYSEISKEVYNLAKEAEQKHNDCDIEISAHKQHLIPDDELAAVKDQLTDLNLQISNLEKAKADADKQLEWQTRHDALLKTLADARIVLEQAKANQESEEIKEASAKITRWDSTAEIRALESEAAGFPAALVAVENRKKTLLQAWAALLGNAAWLEDVLQKYEAERDRLQSIVDAEQEQAEAYANASEVGRLAASVAGRLSLLNQYGRHKSELEASAAESAAKEDELKTKAAEAKAREDKMKAAYEGCLAKARKFDQVQINNALQQAVKAENDAKKAETAYASWQTAASAHADAVAKEKACEEEKAKLESALNADIAKEAEAVADASRAEALYKGYLNLQQHIDEIRAKFAGTHTCPLCGTHDVEFARQETLDAELAEAKKRSDDAASALSDLRKKIADGKGSLQAKVRELTKLSNEARTAAMKLQSAKSEAETYSIDIADENASEALRAACELAAKAVEEATALSNTAAAAQKAMAEASMVNDKAQKDCRQAEKNLADQVAMTANLRQQAIAKQQLIDNETADVEKEVKQMHALAPGHGFTAANASTVAAALAEKAKAYNANVEAAQKAAEKAQEAARALDSAKSSLRPGIEKYGNDAGAAVENKRLADSIHKFFADAHTLEGEENALNQNIADNKEKCGLFYEQNPAISKQQVLELVHTPASAIAAARLAVQNANTALAKAEASQATIEKQIEQADAEKPEMPEDSTIESLQLHAEEKAGKLDDAKRDQAALDSRLKTHADVMHKISDKLEELKGLEAERDEWSRLNGMFGGKEGTTFRNIAQSYMLRILLSKANYYLSEYGLMPRYSLDCEDGSLDILVLDSYNAGMPRDVSSLSGGEGFVVSLALALGLASIKQDTLKVDRLFIDEGFGNLSGDCLDVVIDTLDRLHQVAKRKVGIISHVDGLQDRISARILVERDGTNPSTIRIG